MNTQVEKWFLALPLPGLYDQYTKQGEKLISYICGHREGKQKEKLHYSTTMLMYLQQNSVFLILSFQSSNVSELGWEQNFGGNTEELHSDVFIPSEHLLL